GSFCTRRCKGSANCVASASCSARAASANRCAAMARMRDGCARAAGCGTAGNNCRGSIARFRAAGLVAGSRGTAVPRRSVVEDFPDTCQNFPVVAGKCGQVTNNRGIHVHLEELVFLAAPERGLDSLDEAQRFLHCLAEVFEVYWLGDEVEGAPVHAGADVVQVA